MAVGQAAGAKALLPGTSSVRVTITGDAFSHRESIPVSSNSTSATISGLPVGKLLTITVEALNGSGVVLTSWTSSQTLSRGSNPIAATLSPVNIVPTLATVNPSTMLQLGNAQFTIAQGNSLFLKLTFSATGEFQIIANTGKPEYTWLGAYDSQWQALPVIAQDESQGWLVIAVNAGDVVNLAVSAIAGLRVVDVQARYARFVSTAGSANNPGSSRNPFALLSQAAMDKAAILLSAGDYFENGPTGANLSSVNCSVYGGFNPQDWKVRNSANYVSKISSSAISSSILNLAGTSTRILIDGLRLKAAPITSSNLSSCALNVGNAATDQTLVNNCTIEGPDCAAGVASSVTAVGATIKSGSVELTNSVIDGGNAISSSSGANSFGFQILGGTVYVHGSTVKGGFASATGTSGTATSYGYNQIQSSGAQAIVGSTILGGSAVSANGPAYSYGISLQSSVTNRSIVANNVIYGGYARSAVTGQFGLSYGVIINAQTSLISGNTIIVQSLNANKSSGTVTSPCISIGGGGTATVQYNVFQSSGLGSDVPISIELNGTLSGLVGNCVLSSVGNVLYSPNMGYVGFPTTSATVYGNILPQPWQDASSTLSSFDLSGLSGSSGDSAAWLAANRWWPNAAGLTWFTIPFLRSDGFTSTELSFYPSLLLDRGGYVRSNVQNAKAGAYEYSAGY